MLYRVDLVALREQRYERAFTYLTHLTDSEKGDNRDVFLFPQRILIDGKCCYVCLHRPMEPRCYPEGTGADRPSIFLAAAERLEDLSTSQARHDLLATPLFDWEANRIGGSWPPVALGRGQWLLPYHGKQEGSIGYTQSFMILEETGSFPRIRHRCSQRLMYAQQPWELSGKFPTPCLFTCAGERVGEELLMPYGAADTRVGIARVNFTNLISYVREFDAAGNRTNAAPVNL